MPESSRQSRTESSASFRARRSYGSSGSGGAPGNPRAALARAIPRRPRVSWWLGIVLALGFAAVVTPAITAERWLFGADGAVPGAVIEHQPAPITVRAPMTGYGNLRVGGGVVVARGELVTRDEAAVSEAIAAAAPRGPVLYLALFALTFVLAALFTHHLRRSTKGRLVRVQIVSLAAIAVLAVVVKLVLLATALSALVVPLAVLAMVPTMVLDRVVGLATGVLAALIVSLLGPFDIGLALLLLVQAAAAGLVVAEGTRRRWLPALTAGLPTTLATAATYLLVTYLTSGRAPELSDPLHSPWLAAAIGPALAAVIAAPLVPLYQLLVGEITQGKLIALEDLGHPVLRQIAERSPGTWQHSLMMANMAEIAANAIGASGRLVRVGAYFHDLGKSLEPRYFIENLEAGETSPHDLLPPEVSCDAIFAHVTDGIVAARKAGLHERIVDFMHMHHGNGVLEYFWAKCREQGNPRGLTIEDFRYPGHPPQTRETALLAICDAVEAASRTLTKPDAAAIEGLVQRIVYGKLHLGQLDESGLSMGDLRRISDSLRETIRHANHGRIEYPWQKAGQDASASVMAYTTTAPRLDSLDRKPGRDSARHAAPPPAAGGADAALAVTDDLGSRRSAAAGDPGDPGRVRPGTARNAQAGDEAAAAARGPGLATLPGRAPGPAIPAGEPRSPRGAEREPAPDPDHPGRNPPATAPARAPADSDAGVARAFEHSALAGDPPSGFLSPATFEPAPRAGTATLTGRAPGPAASPEPAAPLAMEFQASTRAAAATGPAPRAPAASLSDDERAPAAPTASRSGGESAPHAPTASRSGGEPAPRAPTASPSGDEPAPHAPTASRSGGEPAPRAPTASRSGDEPAPAAGEPERPAAPGLAERSELLDREAAIALPPAVRQEPIGPAAAPSDPAQLAAALANLVARVSAAPFGKPPADDAVVTQLGQLGQPGQPGQPGIAAGSLSDAAVTQPVLASATRSADADAAVTQPALPRSPAAREIGADLDADAAPAIPAPPTATAPASPPPAAPTGPIAPLPRPTGKPRSSGLAEGGSRSSLLRTLRGHVDETTALRRPAAPVDDARTTVPRAAAVPPDGDLPAARPTASEIDAAVTEPSLPVLAIGDSTRVDVPLRPTPPPAPRRAAPAPPDPARPEWADGLAPRIDAAIDPDSWGNETPIVPPTNAELRALLGQPDPTKQQSIDELERLQRRAAELTAAEPPRRSPHPTTEVDPDDIEAAIELAPPARRPVHPNAIRHTKPRKPE